MLDIYDVSYPTARKIHKCEYCGKEIAKGEKYSYETGKCDGEFFSRKLCLVCKKMLDIFSKETEREEFEWDWVSDWLCDKYCYECLHNGSENGDCKYSYSEIPNCPLIRKHFENREGD